MGESVRRTAMRGRAMVKMPSARLDSADDDQSFQ